MNKKIDLSKLLKDCPSGMELDCTMYENVTFVEVSKDTNILYPIHCITTDENGNRSGCSFTKNGCASSRNSAKCVIFPKDKTTWEGFQRPFKDGDILYIDCNDDENINEQYQYTFILKEISDGKIYCYCYIDEVNINKRFEICWLANMTTYTPRFATKEEKQKFFNTIKENGYEWNEETKTLEKLIVPKFKVGDKIRHKSTGDVYKILFVLSNGYGGGVYDVSITNEIGKSIDVKEQDDYELVPNKFDISTLIPYESKVLIRSTIGSYWQPAFWGAYIIDISDGLHHHDYLTTRGFTPYCIPYDGNEHLIGKTDDCCDFYKTWEE